jgi:hypothetical protein
MMKDRWSVAASRIYDQRRNLRGGPDPFRDPSRSGRFLRERLVRATTDLGDASVAPVCGHGASSVGSWRRRHAVVKLASGRPNSTM